MSIVPHEPRAREVKNVMLENRQEGALNSHWGRPGIRTGPSAGDASDAPWAVAAAHVRTTIGGAIAATPPAKNLAAPA